MVRLLQNQRDEVVSKPDNADSMSLYEKLGGKEAIKKVVESAMIRVLETPMLKSYFDSTQIDLHIKRMAAYICFVIGGYE